MPEGYYGSGFYDEESLRRLREHRAKRDTMSRKALSSLSSMASRYGQKLGDNAVGLLSSSGAGVGAPPAEAYLAPPRDAYQAPIGPEMPRAPQMTQGPTGLLRYGGGAPASSLLDAAPEPTQTPQTGGSLLGLLAGPGARRGVQQIMDEAETPSQYLIDPDYEKKMEAFGGNRPEPQMADEEKLRRLRGQVDIAEGLGAMGNYRSEEEIRLGERPRTPFRAETSRAAVADAELDIERDRKLGAAKELQGPRLEAGRDIALLRQLGQQGNADRNFSLKQTQAGRVSDEVQKELSGRRATFDALDKVRERFAETDPGPFKTRLNRLLQLVGGDDEKLTALDSEITQLFAKWMYSIGGKQLAVQELNLFKGAFADAAQKQSTATELLDAFEERLRTDTEGRLRDLEANKYDVSPWEDIRGGGSAEATQKPVYVIDTEGKSVGPMPREQAQHYIETGQATRIAGE